jgi:VWFA-related protein
MPHRHPLRHFAPLLILVGTFVPTGSAQDSQKEPTFRTQSNVVLVPALVRDKAGEVVYGLQASDFIIEDDGVAQNVLLDEAAESEPVSLVIAIQCGRRADYELPRMHGLGSMIQPLMSQPQTKVAIIAFDSQVHAVEHFTGDSATIARDLRGLESGDDGAAILDAVNYSVRLLDTVPQNRKRVLLLISETRDHGSRTANIDDVIKAIGNSNTVVYTLSFAPWKSNVLDTLKGNNNPDLHPEQTEIHEGPDLFAPFILAVEAMRKNSAKALASLSGGEYRMFDSAKGFDARITDFSNHLHSRYLLSFQPSHPQPGLHQLSVRLKEPGTSTVLARSSYWAKGTQP